MKVRIGAVDLHGFIPEHGLQAKLRLPMKLHKRRFAVGVDEPERVDAEAFHKAE